MVVFYTDSLTGRVPWQFQRMVTTTGGIVPERPAITVIGKVPPGLGLREDFRDPNVFMGPDGRWKMVLSSKDERGGVVLLYETTDKKAK
uniref:Glyco_hydro_32N domain-containing protein n=1 Tax=Globodera pallida TaxID=36090 RepID=A0A183CDW4_GLOPA